MLFDLDDLFFEHICVCLVMLGRCLFQEFLGDCFFSFRVIFGIIGCMV